MQPETQKRLAGIDMELGTRGQVRRLYKTSIELGRSA